MAIDLQTHRITAMEVHYYILCPRKLWWFSHGMEQEHVSGGVGAENVALGTVLHEDSYPGQRRKEILIDGLLRIDFTDDGKVHEIKKSQGAAKATLFQVLYYLYYLKHAKGIDTTAVIDYPRERRRTDVRLTADKEAELERALSGLVETRAAAKPPVVKSPIPVCKSCAYCDLCWG